EASQESDFFTLMRAYQFARNRNFSVEQCRRYGIHAQTARQVDQTFEQIMQLAEKNGLVESRGAKGDAEGAAAGQSSVVRGQSQPITDHGQGTKSNAEARNPQPTGDPLLKCILAGFLDQLCLRRNQGTLECDMTEGRQGTLVRESVVQNASLFVAATIREVQSR